MDMHARSAHIISPYIVQSNMFDFYVASDNGFQLEEDIFPLAI